jgi:hypothetical protein
MFKLKIVKLIPVQEDCTKPHQDISALGATIGVKHVMSLILKIVPHVIVISLGIMIMLLDAYVRVVM